VLTSCDLISEGLDVPNVGAVILLRPTKSLVLHRQQIGRGMRPAPNKAALIVNDHVGNTVRYGLPTLEPAWTLADLPKQDGAMPQWQCPECGCLNPISTRICGACDYQRPAPPGRRGLVTVPGQLKELTEEDLLSLRRQSYHALMRDIRLGRYSRQQLHAIADARGYARGWVWHCLQNQSGELGGAK
jgi:DNA repair protein RadD